MLMISSLHLYPVKACSGLEVGGLEITRFGPAIKIGDRSIYDRQFMFVAEDGDFRTQRTQSLLALIKPQVENDKIFLQIDSKRFELPQASEFGEKKEIKMFGKAYQASLVENALTDAVSAFIGEKLFLALADENFGREVYVKNNFLGVETTFTDSQQFLIVSEESLEDLNNKLQQKVSKDRFRANIWLKGAFPYREDQIKKILHSNYELEFTKGCARCKVITVNQQIGKVENSEPLKVLAEYRKRENQVYFGDYFLSKNKGALIKLFDQVKAEF